MISVLFTQKNSTYNTLQADTWDKNRNALHYPKGNVIIAHPPCAQWGNLATLANKNEQEKELARWAVREIRQHGGILEHPVRSKLWQEMNLPYPGGRDQYNGFSINIDQHWFGHPAKKNTLLYIVGCLESDLPPIPLNFDAIKYAVGGGINKKDLSRYKRNSTPIALARWLIETANIIDHKLNHTK